MTTETKNIECYYIGESEAEIKKCKPKPTKTQPELVYPYMLCEHCNCPYHFHRRKQHFRTKKHVQALEIESGYYY